MQQGQLKASIVLKRTLLFQQHNSKDLCHIIHAAAWRLPQLKLMVVDEQFISSGCVIVCCQTLQSSLHPHQASYKPQWP